MKKEFELANRLINLDSAILKLIIQEDPDIRIIPQQISEDFALVSKKLSEEKLICFAIEKKINELGNNNLDKVLVAELSKIFESDNEFKTNFEKFSRWYNENCVN